MKLFVYNYSKCVFFVLNKLLLYFFLIPESTSFALYPIFTLISDNNFTNNSAVFDGGAIYTPVSDNGVDIGSSNFIGNVANRDGGAIYS